MITLKSCPNCESVNIVRFRVVPDGIIETAPMKGVSVYTQIVNSYFVCRDCHLIFQNPRLSGKELTRVYSSGFYRKLVSKPPEGMDIAEQTRVN